MCIVSFQKYNNTAQLCVWHFTCIIFLSHLNPHEIDKVILFTYK